MSDGRQCAYCHTKRQVNWETPDGLYVCTNCAEEEEA